MWVLIGIDDTDNLESRGTGHLARQMAAALEETRLATVAGITRHQLLVDPRIPYTSHNSAACLVADAAPAALDAVQATCRAYLLAHSADGSDVGLCVAPWANVSLDIQQFGHAAKSVVLSEIAAHELARRHALRLEGLTGSGGGVIGALSAVGLRVGGDDGRFLWLHGLREMSGVYPVALLCERLGIEIVQDVRGGDVTASDRLDVGPWLRPLMKKGRITLLVEEADDNEPYEWRVASRDIIKSQSS